MSESTISTTELTSQYIAQVTADLERNAKDQERVGAEIVALQEQLLALRHDQSVLATMEKALGAADTSQTPSADNSAAPSVPRQKVAAETNVGNRTETKKPAAARRKKAKEPAPKRPAAKAAATNPTGPTLVELVRRHLTEQSEPRSAAEVSAALSQAHPDRGFQSKVVRTTLEGLVAKGHADRTKQGSSVFYTSVSAEPGQ